MLVYVLNKYGKSLIKRLKEEYINFHESYGYEIKYSRDKLGINKSHSNDAYIIVHNFNIKTLNQEYLYKKSRRRNRQIHKSKPSKGAKRSRGYFQLKLFNGTTVTQGVSNRKLKLTEPIIAWMKDWRAAIGLCPKEDAVSSP